jgi:RHH-type proline utilization regulon transcriptional repressor/proline dehydrogenase/delta 1-pyrroline-5-carboxylate dehydrogenase
VFGPVLHFVRYQREELDGLLGADQRHRLRPDLGLHTRIDETIARVLAAAHAGNVYVNRNMVGAVVGVQPFGGEGLSGTGPKAGGPLYLYRLLAHAAGGRAGARAGWRTSDETPPSALRALQKWADKDAMPLLVASRALRLAIAQRRRRNLARTDR